MECAVSRAGGDVESQRGGPTRAVMAAHGDLSEAGLEAVGPGEFFRAHGLLPMRQKVTDTPAACADAPTGTLPRRQRKRKRTQRTQAHGERQTSAELELKRRPEDVACSRHIPMP